ncbi:hypothetical protein [Plantactinospora sp. GCM10030261]|uniref:hypothetical protein n=1 Tax=Plantactinospora sp. GCM10030261 TaxID=3273420 RepID=UPI0036099E33
MGEPNPYASQTEKNTQAPWLTSGEPLEVNLTGLRDYAQHMLDQQLDLASRGTNLMRLSTMPMEAYEGKVLGEAAFLRSQLQANAMELNAYLSNLGQTLFNIGSAAQTIADIYGSGDAIGSADLSEVLFAFGDKSVPRPDGLPAHIGQTYQEALAANAGKSAPPPATSAEWGEGVQTHSSPYQTSMIYLGPNGMVRTVNTMTVPGTGRTVETTTIRDSSGKVISNNTVTTTSSYDAARNTQVKVVESGANTTTTTTRYGSDGEVVNESSQTTRTTNGQEASTGRREMSIDPSTGERVETTYVVKDGKEVVADRVVIGRATEDGELARTTIAQGYDPMAKGVG